MKKIVMLGYSNKLDLVISTAKTICNMQNKVLVIDATRDNKYKYAIPTIEETKDSYISYLDGVDYAVGFESYTNLEQYMFENELNIEDYNYIIFDIEDTSKYEFFKTNEVDKYCFVFDTNMMTFKKNLELFNTIKIYSGDLSDIKIQRILYRAYLTRVSEDYIYNKFNEFGFEFEDELLEIYEDERDKAVALDFLITGNVELKKHTKYYINTVSNLVVYLLEDYHIKTVKKAMKKGGI